MTPVLRPPEPALADEQIRLEPLAQEDAEGFAVGFADEDVKRFTLLPTGADVEFARRWIARYESGWEEGTRAGFSIRDAGDGSLLGFAALVNLELAAQQGEIGYLVLPAARARGAATRAVRLLTDWGLGPLGLERLELRIDPANEGSVRVAQNAGYRLEGVLRNIHFKEGLRTDTGIWSRLRQD